MAGTSPAMTCQRHLSLASGVLFDELVLLDDIEARIDQLATQQRERRLAVEFEGVEGVGEDLGHPDEAGFDVADEEEMHGADSKTARPDHEPDLGHLPHDVGARRPPPD